MASFKITAIALALICATARSQDIQSFISDVNSLSHDVARMAAVDSFIETAPAFPVIEGDTAWFIFRGAASSVQAVGDFNGWAPAKAYSMERLPGTDLWYYGRLFESNARLDYKYIVDGDSWILDPLNPVTITGGFGPNSELAMPQYVQPWEIVDNPLADKGTLIDDSIRSAILNQQYYLKIYLPNDYQPWRWPGYASVYFQDGFEALGLGSARQVLDNLIDSLKMEPVIAVFIKPNNRDREYAFSKRDAYRDFFVNELVPYIDSHYNTIQSARSRTVIGLSLGANISALIAYSQPDVIGNCGLHSGAMWVEDNAVFNLLVNGPAADVRMANIWGSYEAEKPLQMKLLADFFETSGYDHLSIEFPEGHSWGLWRATYDDMLKYFAPYGSADTGHALLLKDLEIEYDVLSSEVKYRFDLENDTGFQVKLMEMNGEIQHHKSYTGSGLIEGSLDLEALPPGEYVFLIETIEGSTGRRISVVKP